MKTNKTMDMKTLKRGAKILEKALPQEWLIGCEDYTVELTGADLDYVWAAVNEILNAGGK
jgi:hypothetical protein